MHYRLWNNSTIVVWLQGQKAFNSNSPFPRSQFFFTSSAHPASIVTSAVDQIWYYIRPGYVWLFSYKVTNSTPSLNRIAPREISDIIWSTFLTSLGCGCVELWNNKVCHLTRDTRAPKKITPLQTYLAKKKKKRGPVETDCAMFTGGRGGRNRALIQPDREDICVWRKLNGLATFFSFFFLHQQYHSAALIKSRAAPVRL